jgi:hypothetical protein
MRHIRFKTESGSLYELDEEAMTWSRLTHSAESVAVRTKSGPMLKWPEVKIGRECRILGPSLSFVGGIRLIETTPVVSVEAL